MSSAARRQAILRELGLWPLWVLRRQAGAPGTDTAPATDIAPAALRAPVRPGADVAAESDPHARAERIARMEWPELKDAVRACTACALHRTRTQTVFGVGDERADWLFVGEAPGAEEDARGEPFVGQAGRLLDNMLAAIGLQRGRDVYIANILKCRPPNNRAPEPGEAGSCQPFLERQVALLRPRLIVALGKTAANRLLRNEDSLASLRGRLHAFRGTPLLVTYHPAYLLRTPADKAKSWEDLCLARETMQRLNADAAAPTSQPAAGAT
jgi:DNA polymerase